MKPLLLLALALIAAPAPAADIDAIFAPLTDAESPGLAVLVRQGGRTIFEKGYGTGIHATTNFRLASFTKQFTAMAVMLLVYDGKLSYDQRLTDILPGFPAYAKSVTVRNLLTHTSGLPDYEDLMKPDTWTPQHQIQDAEVAVLLQQQTAGKFAPGTSWAYSNSGYVVLGLIVAKVSGQPFSQFLRRRIFQPLRMNHTVLYVKGMNTVPNRAYGHTKDGRHFLATDQSATSATQGDGGIYSNLEDLAKWDAALDSHALLSEAEMRPALTPVTLNDGSAPRWPPDPNEDNLHPGQPVQYGFGWFLDPYDGRPRMWHTGSTMGFRTVIERFPAGKLTIIVLCNRTDLNPEKLALQVADKLKQ